MPLACIGGVERDVNSRDAAAMPSHAADPACLTNRPSPRSNDWTENRSKRRRRHSVWHVFRAQAESERRSGAAFTRELGRSDTDFDGRSKPADDDLSRSLPLSPFSVFACARARAWAVYASGGDCRNEKLSASVAPFIQGATSTSLAHQSAKNSNELSSIDRELCYHSWL